jgi:hypothetical protein
VDRVNFFIERNQQTLLSVASILTFRGDLPTRPEVTPGCVSVILPEGSDPHAEAGRLKGILEREYEVVVKAVTFEPARELTDDEKRRLREIGHAILRMDAKRQEEADAKEADGRA